MSLPPHEPAEIGTEFDPQSPPAEFLAPSIFLSGSLVKAGRKDKANTPPATAEQIREAVSHLAQEALARGYSLVFGGHPQISPLVLSVAERLQERDRRPVVCFQSEFFKEQFPPATRGLWRCGRLLLTPDRGDEARSLLAMREAMLSGPDLRAAVYIGGMKGIFDEAELVLGLPRRPLQFALPGTGSAAADLFRRDPERYSGGPDADPELRRVMEGARGQAIVVRRVLDEIERLAGPADAERGSRQG